MPKPFHMIALLVFASASANTNPAHAQPGTGGSNAWDANAQIGELREVLKDVPIAKVADSVAFRIPTGRAFPAFGSAIMPSAREYLREVAASLQRHPGTVLQIEVHSDNVGDSTFLLALSNTRASALRDFLVSRGIDPARVRAEGVGSRNPVGSNDTQAGRDLNRRIEFRIVGGRP